MLSAKHKAAICTAVFILAWLLIYRSSAVFAVQSLEVHGMSTRKEGSPGIFWETYEDSFFTNLVIDNENLNVELMGVEITNPSLLLIKVSKIELDLYIDNIYFGKHQLQAPAFIGEGNIIPRLIPPRTTVSLSWISNYPITISIPYSQMNSDQLKFVQQARSAGWGEVTYKFVGSVHASTFLYSGSSRFKMILAVQQPFEVRT